MKVIAVSRDAAHRFSKPNQGEIRLVEGLGVEGDAHAGATVKHRSRVAKDPSVANLRQVHLIHSELHAELAQHGHHVKPGEMGENVTTEGIDLLGLPEGAVLRLGEAAAVQVTGLRNPCVQLERFQPGLMHACIEKLADGRVVRKAGIMAVVKHGGVVRPGDAIRVELPAGEHRPLKPV